MIVHGGIETVSTIVIDNLIKFGHDIKLVILSPEIEKSKNNALLVDPFLKYKDKIELYSLEENKKDFMKALFKSIFGIAYSYSPDLISKSISEFQPDVIIAVGNPFIVSSIRSSLKMINYDSKIVYWDHGFLFSFFLTSKTKLLNLIKYPLKKHIIKLSLEEADGFLAISSGIKFRISSIVKNKNIYLVFNPIKNYNGNLIKRSPNPKFIYVGRISDYDKDISFLLKGMSKLIYYDWSLKIIGSGPDEIMLKDLSVKLGISDRVEWLGFKKDPYENLDEGVTALLLTSRYEGFPTVLIEANQRGIPVVSSDCQPGPKDIVIEGKNGYLYKEGNMKDFVRIMKGIMDKQLSFDTPENIAKTADRFAEEKVMKDFVNALYKISDS